MKRHLLGVLIALLAFLIGAYIVIYRDRCKAPWVKCAPPSPRASPRATP
jgi:hypothetical protein